MAYLTLERLVDENGEVDPVAYRHMVARRAQNEHGGLSPLALRQAARYYAEIIPVLIMKHRSGRQ